MKLIRLLSLILLCAYCSGCNLPEEKDRSKSENTLAKPKDDNGSLADGKYSRGGVTADELYNDLVKERPDLQAFENQLELFYKARIDSVADFNQYYSKSNSYYESANAVLAKITDTLLKERLRLLLADSKNKLTKNTQQHTALITNVDQQSNAINNYHEALKLITTLPILENYQHKNIPGINSVKHLADKAGILKADALKINQRYGAKLKNN